MAGGHARQPTVLAQWAPAGKARGSRARALAQSALWRATRVVEATGSPAIPERPRAPAQSHRLLVLHRGSHRRPAGPSPPRRRPLRVVRARGAGRSDGRTARRPDRDASQVGARLIATNPSDEWIATHARACCGVNSAMARSAGSRWTLILLALVASFASPGLAVAHGMAHAHGAEQHEAHGRPADTSPGAPADHHDDDRATLSDPEHGHEHDHARVDPVLTGKPDVRDGIVVPLLSGPAPLMQPLATHERSPLSRWDIVALARPAPDTGPPPDLRAPPIC